MSLSDSLSVQNMAFGLSCGSEMNVNRIASLKFSEFLINDIVTQKHILNN